MNNEMNNEVRSRILNSAAQLFGKFGIHKTTIDDIAKKLLMGKSSLYYYFKSKEDIFTAIIENEAERFKHEIIAALEKCSTASERLKTYAVTRMTLFKKLTNTYQAFSDDYNRNYAFVQDLRKKYDDYERDLIATILASGVKAGEFAKTDVVLAAAAIFAAIKGLEFEWAVSATDSEIKRNTEQLLDLLIYGIASRRDQDE